MTEIGIGGTAADDFDIGVPASSFVGDVEDSDSEYDEFLEPPTPPSRSMPARPPSRDSQTVAGLREKLRKSFPATATASKLLEINGAIWHLCALLFLAAAGIFLLLGIFAIASGLASGGTSEAMAGGVLGVGAVVYALVPLLGAFLSYLNAYLSYAGSECILSWAAKQVDQGFAPVR